MHTLLNDDFCYHCSALPIAASYSCFILRKADLSDKLTEVDVLIFHCIKINVGGGFGWQ